MADKRKMSLILKQDEYRAIELEAAQEKLSINEKVRRILRAHLGNRSGDGRSVQKDERS